MLAFKVARIQAHPASACAIMFLRGIVVKKLIRGGEERTMKIRIFDDLPMMAKVPAADYAAEVIQQALAQRGQARDHSAATGISQIEFPARAYRAARYRLGSR